MAAYQPDPNVLGVYGFSVQYSPNLDWEVLAQAGQFPHSSVCYAERSDLEVAVAQLGYAILLIATPGKGYHHELSLTLMQIGVMLQSLPIAVAKALSSVFQQHNVAKP